jgi:hypothetical protein
VTDRARAIFRESAVEAYRRRSERDVVPRVTSRPVIAAAWALLAVLVAAALAAWSVRLPTYVAAQGVIVARAEHTNSGGETAAVLFVAPDRSSDIRVGQHVHGQIGSSRRYVDGVVAGVGSRLLGPDAARVRYRLDGRSDLVTEPSLPVTVRLGKGAPAAVYAGTRLTARVEVGRERVLGLFW